MSVNYGLSSSVAKKMAAKRDPELDAEAQSWIEEVIGESFPSDVLYEDALKDGVLLCKLMNKIKPGSVAKINVKGNPFALRENIQSFQNAARAYGVPDNELFQSVDLFDKKNIPQVTLAIHSLGRYSQKKGFSGPHLGPKMSDENKREFTDEQLRAGDSTIGLQAGYNKGASQSGQSFGTQRHM